MKTSLTERDPGSVRAPRRDDVNRSALALDRDEHAASHDGEPRAGVAACTCHASSFDGDGAVLTGPATRPLQHFAVAVCEGEVYVDTATRVAANVRLAVA